MTVTFCFVSIISVAGSNNTLLELEESCLYVICILSGLVMIEEIKNVNSTQIIDNVLPRLHNPTLVFLNKINSYLIVTTAVSGPDKC